MRRRRRRLRLLLLPPTHSRSGLRLLPSLTASVPLSFPLQVIVSSSTAQEPTHHGCIIGYGTDVPLLSYMYLVAALLGSSGSTAVVLY